MVNSEVKKEVLTLMSRLSEKKQREVLEFAKSLRGKSVGISGKELLKYAGCLPEEVCDRMEKAIEEGCERVDPDGW